MIGASCRVGSRPPMQQVPRGSVEETKNGYTAVSAKARLAQIDRALGVELFQAGTVSASSDCDRFETPMQVTAGSPSYGDQGVLLAINDLTNLPAIFIKIVNKPRFSVNYINDIFPSFLKFYIFFTKCTWDEFLGRAFAVLLRQRGNPLIIRSSGKKQSISYQFFGCPKRFLW